MTTKIIKQQRFRRVRVALIFPKQEQKFVQ